VEAAILDRTPDLLVRIADQPAVPGETGDNREIALGDAESHVGPRRLAPLGDDPAVAQHEPGGPAARAHRPERLVPWGAFLEVAGHHQREIARPRRFAFCGVPGGGA